MLQRTIQKSVTTTGVSLHLGSKTDVCFRPAPVNSGICFIRNGIKISAIAENSTQKELATSINCNGEYVQTIEHLMAAISSLMIDNLIIDVSTNELPIMDGSAAPYFYLLDSAGIKEQNHTKQFIQITKSIIVYDQDKFVSISPCNQIRYSLTTKFNHPFVDTHTQIDYTYKGHLDFLSTVARARTFGFIKDFEFLTSKNLAMGAGLNNAIILDDYGMINEEPLRYSDEFIRHKLLDAIGDMRLLGHNFIGHYKAHKPSHALNRKLVSEILKQKAYSLVSTEEACADVMPLLSY